mmetsp:Transcript_61408/g.107532  ORF Transcript_61408/g.107532 Transcript_61408/m.107532 type:complete len:117 (-) Transcript_61408:6-356(-)
MIYLIVIFQGVAFCVAVYADHKLRLEGNWTENMYCNNHKREQQKLHVTGLLATAILGGDDLADFHNFSKNVIWVNVRYAISYDLWVHPLDVKLIMGYDKGRPGNDQPHSFEGVPII